jgi:hypothetical protein
MTTDTTRLPEKLQAIDGKVLTPLVRKLFGSDAVEVLNWQIYPIQFGIINPITVGIFRFKGTAQHHNTPMPWSMVLKILQSPEMFPEEVRLGQNSLFNMQRELSVYHSDLSTALPECIVMPRFFGMIEQPDNTAWLWIEDIQDFFPSPPGWPVERYALAGRHLGIFNGRYLTKLPLPDYPWLSRGFLRTGIPFLMNFVGINSMLLDSAIWENPFVRCAYPKPVAERFLNLVAKSTLLVGMVERLPQVLCHLDVNCGNLFSRHNKNGYDQTVIIDWSFCGINAVGVELGQLIWGSIPSRFSISEITRLEGMVYENYLAGLREAGWNGDKTIVRFGYLTQAFCNLGIFRMYWNLNLALDPTRQALLEQVQHRPITEILEEEGAAVYSLIDRGEEAVQLLDKVAALL